MEKNPKKQSEHARLLGTSECQTIHCKLKGFFQIENNAPDFLLDLFMILILNLNYSRDPNRSRTGNKHRAWKIWQRE